jgi:hypothetical protein
MLRIEFLIVGLILTVTGVGVFGVGYSKSLPTVADQVITFLGSV